MRTLFIIALCALVAGCARSADPPDSLPRTIVWGTGQPACIMLCEISIVANDNESDFNQGRGTVSSNKSSSTAINQTQTYAPVAKPSKGSRQ